MAKKEKITKKEKMNGIALFIIMFILMVGLASSFHSDDLDDICSLNESILKFPMLLGNDMLLVVVVLLW